jgi:NADPH:quinone reductase-like Zn-dependent oxidoreductase
MRAVYFTEHGDVSKLTYGDLPDPVSAQDEVVVRVRACGVNHVDVWVRRGLPFLRLQYPFVLGQEIAGEIVSASCYSERLLAGARVVVHPGVGCGRCELCFSGNDHHCSQYQLLGKNLPGGYAELVAVPASNVFPLPEEISFESAACLPTVFTTAWNMVFDQADLKPGEWILVHAAGSGVGSAAIQLASLAGARVIATAGSNEKAAKARSLGAEYVINYRTDDFLHHVRKLTGKRGVDVVIDHIGVDVWERSLLCLATAGRLVTCGASSGYQAVTDLRHVFFRQLRIFGATCGSRATLMRIVQLVQEKKVRPVLDTVLPLTEAARAHTLLEERQQFGKVVLVPA